MTKPENIIGKTPAELVRIVQKFGFPDFHGKQIANWIYKRSILGGSTAGNIFTQMTDLSLQFRKILAENYYLGNIKITNLQKSEDAYKFQLRLNDGQIIEAALIFDLEKYKEFDNDNEEPKQKNRITACLSTQVGCRMGCLFCASSYLPYVRNLKASEILEQLLLLQKAIAPQYLDNIVLMGIGEPLDNLSEVVKALKIMLDPLAMDRSPRRITLSTVGLIPELQEFSKESLKVNLAISLNAANDTTRSKLMPINKRYPLNSLIQAGRNYPLPRRRRLTFEYVLLKGINDRSQDAIRLAKLLKGIPSKVNLIPYNPIKDLSCDFLPPDESSIDNFCQILVNNYLTVNVRRSRGGNIQSACGQLRVYAA